MEKWLVISACQTVGLANCIQSLVPDVLVTGIDFAQFNSDPKRFGNEMSSYSKLFINPGVSDLLPADEIDKIADHVAAPAVFFRAYHPDLVYLERDGKVLLGPLGDYHSAIAYACYMNGMSISDTLRHFNGSFYERCGYMSIWVSERDRLIREMADSGIDIADPIRRWGRDHPFMHSSNHPRIHALHDVAKELVRMQGRTPISGGIIPHDNLQLAPHFAIYPEIGEELGVEGSYIFKNDTYRPIDLNEFIIKSFEVYDSDPRNPIVPHPHYKSYVDSVSKHL
ncbi:WcbI family polysaccharide biosynthesis putative acetyltransferase [Sphingobium mellinum]|uniref:WcbI family polysaccharide biosynthesis putative acetyltransferase n=1 Tax=Sphingobium mellinum TaxID=1387166 RepID=UPI0030EEE2A8